MRLKGQTFNRFHAKYRKTLGRQTSINVIIIFCLKVHARNFRNILTSIEIISLMKIPFSYQYINME